MRCRSRLVRSPSVSLYDAKMIFRSGFRPATQAMKSVTAIDLPDCGCAMMASFGRRAFFQIEIKFLQLFGDVFGPPARDHPGMNALPE